MKNKRYLGTIDFYLWADNDEDANKQLQEICSKMRKEKDNQAKPVFLHETPFAQLTARKVEL